MPASGGGHGKGLGANHSLPLICTPSNCIPVLFLPPDHLFQPLRQQQGRIVVCHVHFAFSFVMSGTSWPMLPLGCMLSILVPFEF
ncbi:hypothetical protein H9Q72_014245 [Fusarium xylarioides]|uniref:Uncharacterized protein n=1 Tax=Fusarium xylarioides TaxID=221167 RepID=A0A9P7HC65_9HYPO|nr:hypothetical protein H9Q70_014385 [Fusarium xylarioides]KAG5757611.1 hypothetical protein H9Q72_014245 [Fusarium xylarioides]KAG5810125.1 hypothetical protein H9Q74_014091 [Fusarium xylarioides]